MAMGLHSTAMDSPGFIKSIATDNILNSESVPKSLNILDN